MNTLDVKQKIGIICALVALFGLGFFITTRFSSKKNAITNTTGQTGKAKATLSPQPSTTLSLSPSTKTVKVGETLSLTVMLTGDKAQAVDITLTFDPAVFSASDIAVGQAFPVVLRQRIVDGKIIVSASIDPSNQPESNPTGAIFTVNLTALGTKASTTVDFEAKDTIVAQNGKNIVGKTVAGTYTVIE